jgi:membrane-associated phospholipid phosphatase
MTKIERFILYPLLVGLLILFGFYDLPIMQALYDQSNWFGRAGELIGEAPLQLLGVVAGLWLFRFRDKSTKKRSVWFGILFAFVALAFAAYGGGQIWMYLKNKYTTYTWRPGVWIAFPVAALYLIAGGLIAFLPKISNGKEAKVFSYYVIIIYFGVILLMNGFKFIWDRPRWRALVYDTTDPASGFVPWYKISFDGHFTDAEASFPSGHTMNALAWMILGCASTFIDKLKGKEWIIRLSAYVWAILVAVSRTIRGAHFPSDTTAGFLICLLFIDLMTTFFWPTFRKKLGCQNSPTPSEETKAA